MIPFQSFFNPPQKILVSVHIGVLCFGGNGATRKWAELASKLAAAVFDLLPSDEIECPLPEFVQKVYFAQKENKLALCCLHQNYT